MEDARFVLFTHDDGTTEYLGAQPFLKPAASTRNGYVPNVVYSRRHRP